MTQPTPQVACHKNCKKREQHSENCELVTVSASQLSSFFICLVYISIAVVNQLFVNDNPSDAEGVTDTFVKIFITITFSMTIIYFFLGCWATEEDMIEDLRGLKKKRYFYGQWILRILILSILASFNFATNLLFEYFKHSHKDNDAQILASLCFLTVIFFFFVIWDLIVIAGGKWDTIKYYFCIDLLGLGVIVCGFTYHRDLPVGLAFLIIGWLGLVATYLWQIFKGNFLKTFSRVLNINSIR